MADRGRPKKHFVGRTNFTVRLDVPLRDRIRDCSAAGGRSMSEEIARRVERSFLQDDLVAAVREEIAKAVPQHSTKWPQPYHTVWTAAPAGSYGPDN